MSERQKKKLAQREANKQKRRMIEKVLSRSKFSNLAFNLNLLVDGWLEIESDPGTFSLLIEDFGCFGAQVDEIYDLEQKFEGPVFGFIFLFKWLNNQSNDRLRNQKSTSSLSNNNSIENNNEQPYEQGRWAYVEDENIISEIFFAKQMISNSCATHALISILLNCDYEELNLGPTLTRLKEHTKVMDPENKGYAIGNLPELAKAHNSHASFSSLYNRNKPSSHSATGMSYMISGNQRTNLQQQNKHEAYHFVSYVPINNRLYELDGLKNYPIDHGPFGPKEDWTEKFRRVIKQRLSSNRTGDDTTSNDIRYNLMAVVPDRRVYLRSGLRKLKYHQKLVQDSIKRLTKRTSMPFTMNIDIPNPPYSPLSNATLTADESSSYNSPSDQEDNQYSEDNKIDKYFFIKFDQQANSSSTKKDNSQLAHSNCIVDIQPTNVTPINLTIDINGTSKKEDNVNSANNNNNNDSKIHSDILTVLENSEKRLDASPHATNHIVDEKTSHVNEAEINGLIVSGHNHQMNEKSAHSNEMYNLSSKPPFDFNILDDMQHVHYDKSTLRDMLALSQRLSKEIEKLESSLKEEFDKRRKYKIDNSRKTHNYEPFIMTFLSMLAQQGNLADLIERDLGINLEDPTTTAQVSNPPCKTQKPPTNTPTKVGVTVNGGEPANKSNPTVPKTAPTKPKYKYVSTGRPVGRPRKNPLVPPPVKTSGTK